MRRLLLLLFFLTISETYANDIDEAAISAPVIELHDALLVNMQTAESVNFSDRYMKIEEVINRRFDTPLIAKVILGRNWKSLDQQSQERFIDLFNQLTITTYVSRFDSFNDQSFNITSIEPMKKNRFLVKSKIERKDDEAVSLDYIVHENGTAWKIISVIANGVNDLSLKRAEYAAVIKDSQFSGLLTNIETKIAELKAQ